MKKFIVFIVIFLFFSINIFCQNEDEIVDTSYGVVVSISNNQIIVKEYDYEKYQDVNILYKLDDNLELVNIKSLSELKSGDNIDIDYVIRNKSRVALTVILTNDQETDEDNNDLNNKEN